MVYGYLRVSTDIQDIASQKIGVEKKAKSLNLEIDNWISDEGISGAKEPEERRLGKLLKSLKKNDILLVSEISRLGRSLYMVMRILEGLTKKGVSLYSDKDGYVLDDTISSKVLAFAFGLAAEIERDMIRKRTTEGRERAIKEGMIMGTPAGLQRKGVYKLDKIYDKVIKLINKGLSLNKIAIELKCEKETVKRFIERHNIDYVPKRKLTGCSLVSKLNNDIENHRGKIIEMLNIPLRFLDMREYLIDKYNLFYSEKTIRFYIRNDKELNELYVLNHLDKRFKANGAIIKQHPKNISNYIFDDDLKAKMIQRYSI